MGSTSTVVYKGTGPLALDQSYPKENIFVSEGGWLLTTLEFQGVKSKNSGGVYELENSGGVQPGYPP
jgi:hypothetical protein